MKLIPTLFILLLNAQNYNSCTADTLFMFHMGMSKFQVVNYLNSNSNIDNLNDETFFSYWCHFEPDSISRDSVYKSFVTCDRKFWPCMTNYKSGNMEFDFLNQKLFRIRINIFFEPKHYNDCVAAYNYWRGDFKKRFLFNNEGPYYKDEKTKTQVGEFTIVDVSKASKNSIDIIYEMLHQKDNNEYGVPTYENGTVDSYCLTITYEDWDARFKLNGNGPTQCGW